MPSVLIRRLIDEVKLPELTTDTIDAFLDAHDTVMLFFTENPMQFPESNDVAVILPELVRAFEGQLSAAVIARASDRELQKRYGFGTWPSLVFLRKGEYLGVISKVQDWNVYLQEIKQILQSEARRAPGFKIPIMAQSTSDCQ